MNFARRSLRLPTTIIIHTIIIVNSKIIVTMITGGMIKISFEIVCGSLPLADTVHSTLNNPKNAVSSQLSEIGNSDSGIIEVRALVEVAGVS